MTEVLFEEYVRWFDRKMDGRMVLLVIDNCPAHPKVVQGLPNIELFFIPPNTTSKIQPCDARIIRAFKIHYHTWMSDVKNITIANFFQHYKLRSVENVVSKPLKEEGIMELGSTINELHYHNAMNDDQILDYPGKNDTTEILTDEEIIEGLRENNQDEDNEGDNRVLEPVSRKEAIRASMKLGDFLLQYDRSTPQLHKAL
ncbi:uncharacterized protein LOC124943428 [Impatiens glandulifera]|uniref:uncharacterized protein LOC124943428 n=1 Tax=Impatiens glandulifera TaxID=253017 RepID=UPI001FB08E5C|nr:uncharacterized protein LOC124943428 [Impatiens glandulifera]